jgi:uncharacterized protein (DUF2147 family)
MMPAMRRAVIAVTFALFAAPAAAADPSGTWLTADGEARVQISNCGSAYCGRIVWLKEPNDPQTGKPKLDKFNKDASKQSRPVVCLQIISGMQASGANLWKGSLYDPEDGNTFTGSLAMQGDDRMKLEGCVLALFCRSEVWKRVH